jgi:hypothetical protein
MPETAAPPEMPDRGEDASLARLDLTRGNGDSRKFD